MNKKIKKILKDLELCNGFYDFIIEPADSKTLVDYIKSLQQENVQLKEDIKNIIKILSKNCDDLEATEEEFESLDRWQELEQGRDSNDSNR